MWMVNNAWSKWRYAFDHFMRSRFDLVLAIILSAVTAHALTWDAVEVNLEIEAGTPELRVEFRFRNESTQQVTVTELKPSCGCTQVELTNRVIPPGGKGVLTAVYKPGDRVGQQESRVTVKTDEPSEVPTSLLLRVNISPVLIVKPAMLRWEKGGAAVAQAITLTRVGEATVRIVRVTPASDGVVTELKPGATGDAWELWVTPRSTVDIITTKIEIVTEVRGQPATFNAFAVVR
jgi:hypothetical protein